jgi:putative hydrolase of the HAD superfamily
MSEHGVAPDTILFDVGGVLVELGPGPLPPGLGISFDRYLESDAAKDFEKGLIGADEFARAIAAEFSVDADAAALIEHFRAWPSSPYPGAIDLLTRLRRDYGVAILSNTNELHWQRFGAEFGLLDCCDRAFGSHLLGMIKPDPKIFVCVIDALGTAPESILFLDDNPTNVAVARAGGMQAELVRDFGDVVRALAARGIVANDSRFGG